MIPLTAALDIAEIVAGEQACDDEWFPGAGDEFRRWLERQDDATADQQDGDRCPECGSALPCDCLAEDDNPHVGDCDACGGPITSDQLERTHSTTQWNGCDVDLSIYRCACGAQWVD